MIFLICACICFAENLLRILPSIFFRDISLQFSFVVSLAGLGIKVILASFEEVWNCLSVWGTDILSSI